MPLVACARIPRQRPGDRAADALLVGIEAGARWYRIGLAKGRGGTGGAAMSGLTRFFASTVLIFSFFVFVPGGAEARWYGGTGMEAGAAAGVPLSGLDLGSAMAYRRAWRCW